MKAIGIMSLVLLSSCGRSGDAAAIADLQRRVAALEKQSAPSPANTPVAAKGYELLAPALGNERRLYPDEARCEAARNQILSDVAGRAAQVEAENGGRRIFTVPPFVSCVPA